MSEPLRSPPPTPPYVPAGYRPSPTYAPPPGYAPPPAGYGPWAPQSVSGPEPTARRQSAALGLVSFLLALIAAFATPIVAAIAGFRVGLGAGSRITSATSPDFDWSLLSPVREWVLLGEVAFWTGTVLGIWAIVQGSVAIAKNRGRGWGIAAVVIAVIGPFVFGFAVWMFAFAGLASGASAGG